MPNPIKYNTSAETLALKKGNFWIGTGDVGKGPTSSTGFYNGATPPSGGYTIYLNKASGGPSIYTVSNEAQLTALTNSLSVSTNLIKNNNGGNFADGTLAPFNGSYGTLPTVVDITNDKPYNGSTSTKAAKFVAGGGMLISTDPSPFTMTVGVTYTFSFWYRQTNSNNFYIGFNNQGGSGDMNGNFQSYSLYGYFPNPTQTWQRCSWTFTNVVNKPYFFIYSTGSDSGSECLMTEFTLTEGSMPSGPGLTTAGNCLNWFATQSDKIIFSGDYPAIVTSGLTLNLDAGFSPSFATIPSNANNSTVTPWYDLSPSGNNATLTNSPTYSSTNGGAIVFDGVDDYVLTTLNASSFTSLDMSLGLWFNTKTIKNNTFTLLSGARAGNDSYQPLGFFIETRDSWAGSYSSKPGIVAISNYPRYAKSIPNAITNDAWYYVVQTATETQTKLYINGALVDTTTANTTLYTSIPYYFGVGNYGNYGVYPGTTQYSSNYSNQNIAVTQVYNRVLSQTEIIQNYQSMLPRFVGENIITDGLVLYLDVGYKSSYSGSGTTWYDVSGYGNHGTLTNGPTFNSSNGGNIVFDGVDDYTSIVGVNSLFEVANATFTVNMWVYAYAIQNRMGLWGKNDAYEFGFISSGSIQFWSPGGTFSVAIVDNNYLNQWKMITSINSPQGSYVYSNGVLIGSGGQLSGVGGSSFAIGSGFDPPGTNTFNGRISITQIYNRALTATEILQNYNAQKGRYGL